MKLKKIFSEKKIAMKILFKVPLFLFLLFFSQQLLASQILIPMDDAQKNHLKAYGIAYWTLENQVTI